ncbi:MAG: YgeY family selenium metabolism-linked hydrolase [Clostridia bacterium]
MDRNEILVALTQSLIQAKSYSGQENRVADTLSEFFTQNHFDKIQVDAYGNIIGSIFGKKPGPALLFDGHIDTVPVTDPSVWTHPPFAAEIENDRIYGRGASDMKGAVAAMACAAASFAKDTDRSFAGSIHVAGVVHEECFEGVACRLVRELIQPDIVIIGEASELNLKIGQRGRAEIKVETFGKNAHSANPEKGINAVYAMCRLIEKIRTIQPPVCPRLGKGILELTDIKSLPYPGASVVPDDCVATYDRRLLTGETTQTVLMPILQCIEELHQEDPSIRAHAFYTVGDEPCYTGETIHGERFFPAWLEDSEADYIQKVKARMDAAGINPAITQYNFCTNGSHYAGEAGIRTIGFGPSMENLAHTVDEYIEIDQLKSSFKGYTCIMEALLMEE